VVAGLRDVLVAVRGAIGEGEVEAVPADPSGWASRVEELRRLCDNPFRVACLPGPSGTPVYCRPYEDVNDWYVGEAAYRLDWAADGLLAGAWGIGGPRRIMPRRGETVTVFGRR